MKKSGEKRQDRGQGCLRKPGNSLRVRQAQILVFPLPEFLSADNLACFCPLWGRVLVCTRVQAFIPKCHEGDGNGKPVALLHAHPPHPPTARMCRYQARRAGP